MSQTFVEWGRANPEAYELVRREMIQVLGSYVTYRCTEKGLQKISRDVRRVLSNHGAPMREVCVKKVDGAITISVE